MREALLAEASLALDERLSTHPALRASGATGGEPVSFAWWLARLPEAALRFEATPDCVDSDWRRGASIQRSLGTGGYHDVHPRVTRDRQRERDIVPPRRSGVRGHDRSSRRRSFSRRDGAAPLPCGGYRPRSMALSVTRRWTFPRTACWTRWRNPPARGSRNSDSSRRLRSRFVSFPCCCRPAGIGSSRTAASCVRSAVAGSRLRR